MRSVRGGTAVRHVTAFSCLASACVANVETTAACAGACAPGPAGVRAFDGAPRATLRRPVAWVHIPKTGTSFINAVMSEACDDNWRFWLGRELERLFWARARLSRGCAGGLTSSVDTARKESAFRATAGGLPMPDPHGWYRSPPGHTGFGRFAVTNAPLAVTVLRQPEQRLLSGYHANTHGWREPQQRGLTPLLYAQKLQGCQVRFLTRAGDQCSSRDQPPDTSEVEQALRTLERFQFVGISEQWDLTVCLFHKMFGGGRTTARGSPLPWWSRCNASHFYNTRPTGVRLAAKQPAAAHASTQRDIAELDGFIDHADRRLYGYGRYLFRRRLAEYNVTRESCAPCIGHRVSVRSFGEYDEELWRQGANGNAEAGRGAR